MPSKIQIVGTINEGAKRIEINLHGSNGEFLLHFNPRFDVSVYPIATMWEGGGGLNFGLKF